MQGNLFIAGVADYRPTRRSITASPLPRPGQDGERRLDPEGEVPEEQSGHDPESTPLNCVYLVLRHGERMGFRFQARGDRLMVSPRHLITEDDRAVIQHFKKEILLVLRMDQVFENRSSNAHG